MYIYLFYHLIIIIFFKHFSLSLLTCQFFITRLHTSSLVVEVLVVVWLQRWSEEVMVVTAVYGSEDLMGAR